MINNISYEQIKDIRLGAIYSKDETTFKVFAPSVEQIFLAISKDYRNPRKDFIKMEKGEYDIYQVTLSGDYEGYFYSYFVDDKYMVTDPYSFASSINSMYSVVCDMEKTNPQGFLETPVPQIPENEAIIYELNVKNYTADETSGVKDRGKYLGLCQESTTYKGLATGIDNLVDLGVTHVQLLPIYDFISVDESNDRFFDDDNYNWGYDPELYFNPEGSYATDPPDPTNRIFEIKEMIGKFHKKNIAVVMDVVFNHTFKSYDSNLNTLGKNYYHRMTKDGYFSNGTGVGNELASERPFVRKLIIDSLKYWVKEYKIDGFRFDLMAIIDLDTIKLAVKELRKINPNIIIYGEPWMALETTLPANLHTIKGSQRSNGFGVFNDIFRDAIKGDTDSYGTGYIQGDYYLKPIIEQSIAGSITYDDLRSGFADDASESINYFNCHDNLILYDKLQISLKNLDQIDDYVKLAMGLIFLSFGKVFLYEGNEFNHTKKNDRNSYNSPLFVNAINWNEKEEHIDIFNYTKDLVELRKSLKAFRRSDPAFIRNNLKFMDGLKDSMIIYSLEYNGSKNLVVINVGQDGEIIPRRSIESFIGDKKLRIDNIFNKEGKNTSKKIETDLYVDGLSINVYNLGGENGL